MNIYDMLIAQKISGGGGGSITPQLKNALLAAFSKVAWVDENGNDYYSTLQNALYSPADLSTISAVYSGGSVTSDASLDSLKSDLVVTATWSDSSTSTVASAYYTLSGSLSAGTSTITVTYLGKTTSFNVTVTAINGWDYVPSMGLLSAQDFVTVNNSSTLTPTEEIVDGSLHISAPMSSTNKNWILELSPNTFTNYGYMKIKIKIVQSGHNNASTTTSNGTPTFRISNGSQGVNIGFAKYAGSSGDLKIRPNVDNTSTWGSNITMGEWHTIELEYNNSKQTVTVDGVAELTDANPSTLYTTNNRVVVATSTSGITEFYIDEIKYREYA